MKNKKALGLVPLALALVLAGTVSFLLSTLDARVNLGDKPLCTLTPNTKRVLGNLGELKKKVSLKFFFSESAKGVPSPVRAYAELVRDLLREYERAGRGNVALEFYDPEPGSEAEALAAEMYQLTPVQECPDDAPCYFGLVAVCGKHEHVVPCFDRNGEPKLEYEITRCIARAVRPGPPVIGVLSSISVMQRSYVFYELNRAYEMREVANDAESIDPDVETLVVIQPHDLSARTLFAIDQFVLRGGKLVACVSPSVHAPSPFGKLFDAWGVSFDSSKCVADASQRDAGGKLTPFLDLYEDGILKDDVLTADISKIRLVCPGALEFKPTDGLTFTPILTTSTNATALVDVTQFMNASARRGEVKPDGACRTLAARVTGTFKTAFPDGPPRSGDSTNSVSHVIGDGEGSVCLIANTAFLMPMYYAVPETKYFYDKDLNKYTMMDSMRPTWDNARFFKNVVDVFSDGDELIGIRVRSRSDRPFKTVDDLRADTMKKYEAKADELRRKLHETDKILSELEQGPDGQTTFLEWWMECKKAREQRIKTKRAIKDVYNALDEETMKLGAKQLGVWLKAINICLVPLMVLYFGMVHALSRRRRDGRMQAKSRDIAADPLKRAPEV